MLPIFAFLNWFLKVAGSMMAVQGGGVKFVTLVDEVMLVAGFLVFFDG